ncbi:MAG: hypothetical protein ACI9FN_002005 [Saprospiraceae bacterium]
MITIFKKNDLLNVLLLLPYTILLRLYSLVNPQAYQVQDSDSFLSTYIFSNLITSPITQAIVAIALVYGHALLINHVVNKNRIYQRPSSLAGMTYILLVSCIQEFQQLTPALIGLSFLILTVFSIFNTYKQTNAVKAITNSALNASVASIVYPPYSIIIVALLIGLGILRSFGTKEKLQFLTSWFVMLWVFGSFLFFLGVLDWGFWNQVGLVGTLSELWSLDQNSYVLLGVTAVLIFIVISNYYNYKKKKAIEIRKKIDFFYWMLLMGFVSLLLFKNLESQHLIVLCMPIAVFVSMSWLLIRQPGYAEIFHFSALGLIFYNLFYL